MLWGFVREGQSVPGGLPEMVGGVSSDVCIMGAKELDLPLDSLRRHWVSERWFVASIVY